MCVEVGGAHRILSGVKLFLSTHLHLHLHFFLLAEISHWTYSFLFSSVATESLQALLFPGTRIVDRCCCILPLMWVLEIQGQALILSQKALYPPASQSTCFRKRAEEPSRQVHPSLPLLPLPGALLGKGHTDRARVIHYHLLLIKAAKGAFRSVFLKLTSCLTILGWLPSEQWADGTCSVLQCDYTESGKCPCPGGGHNHMCSCLAVSRRHSFLIVITASGSYILSAPNSVMTPKHVGQLWVSVNQCLLKTDSSLMRVERFINPWDNNNP